MEANPALAVILGHACREDLLDRPLAGYFEKPDDWSELSQRYSGRPGWMSLVIRRLDGTTVHCAVTAAAFRDPDGGPAGTTA